MHHMLLSVIIFRVGAKRETSSSRLISRTCMSFFPQKSLGPLASLLQPSDTPSI